MKEFFSVAATIVLAATVVCFAGEPADRMENLTPAKVETIGWKAKDVTKANAWADTVYLPGKEAEPELPVEWPSRKIRINRVWFYYYCGDNCEKFPTPELLSFPAVIHAKDKDERDYLAMRRKSGWEFISIRKEVGWYLVLGEDEYSVNVRFKK